MFSAYSSLVHNILESAAAPDAGDADRRTAVLQAALLTFARFGYRKTSMDQVARDAGISRPGLYFLFASKQALFCAAVERSLRQDLAAVEHALGGSDGPFQQRLLHAFDQWAGGYIGPLARDVTAVVEDNPDVLGPMVKCASQRFAQLIADAVLTQQNLESAERVVQTLISTSIGIKHQVNDRPAYLERLAIAIDLLLVPGSDGTP